MENIILHVTYFCKEGMAQDFVNAVKDSGVQALVRAENGCLQYDYHLSLEQDNAVVLLEKWRDSEALSCHMAQPHMETLKDFKSRFVLDTRIERYE